MKILFVPFCSFVFLCVPLYRCGRLLRGGGFGSTPLTLTRQPYPRAVGIGCFKKGTLRARYEIRPCMAKYHTKVGFAWVR